MTSPNRGCFVIILISISLSRNLFIVTSWVFCGVLSSFIGTSKSKLGLITSIVLNIQLEKSSYEGFVLLVIFIVRRVSGSQVYHEFLSLSTFSLPFVSRKFVNLVSLFWKLEILVCVDFKNFRDLESSGVFLGRGGALELLRILEIR